MELITLDVATRNAWAAVEQSHRNVVVQVLARWRAAFTGWLIRRAEKRMAALPGRTEAAKRRAYLEHTRRLEKIDRQAYFKTEQARLRLMRLQSRLIR